MDSLKELVLRKITCELESPYSVLFGVELPGILTAVEASHFCDELWRRHIDNNARMALTMPSLRPFFCSDTIRELTLTQLTDSLAHELTPLHFPCLEDLSIVDSPGLTDAGVRSGLVTFDTLDSLRLEKCMQLTWRSVGRVKPTRKLAIIQALSGGNVSGQDLLARNVRTHLYLEETQGDALVTALKKELLSHGGAPELRELCISRSKKVDDSFTLACLNAPGLRVVVFSFCELTKQGLENLAFLSDLQELNVSHCQIRFHIVEQEEERNLWGSFAKLRCLDLSGCGFGMEPSRALIAVNKFCPALESFTARSAKLDHTVISPQAMREMLTKRRVLDLAGNKKVNDENLQLEQRARTSVRKLNLANTGIQNPALRSAQWPVLSEIILDGCTLNQRFVVTLLAAFPSEAGQVALPTKVSLRECKSLDDKVLVCISDQGGLRPSLEFLDLTNSSCSMPEVFILKRRSHHPKLVLLPEVNDALYLPEEAEGLNNDEMASLASLTSLASSGYSSIQSHVLRRFVRHVDQQLGHEGHAGNSDSDEDISDHDGDDDDDLRRFELSEQDVEIKRDLLELCCHCAACAVAHRGAIAVPKVRYSKLELLSIRDGM